MQPLLGRAIGAAVLTALGMAPSKLAAQKRQTVEVARCETIGEDLTVRDARQRAINNTLAEASRQVAGVQLQGEQRIVRSDLEQSMQSVVVTSTSGVVVDHKMLESRVVADTINGDAPQHVCYRVKIRADVMIPEERPDPSFQISAVTDRGADAVYFDRPDGTSDSIVLKITSSKDAYLTIFDVWLDTASVLISSAGAHNEIKAGVPYQFPPEGSTLRAKLPKGLKRSSETFAVVATRTPIAFLPGPDSHTDENGTVYTNVGDFQKWLAGIPIDQRTQATVSYEIRGAPKK